MAWLNKKVRMEKLQPCVNPAFESDSTPNTYNATVMNRNTTIPTGYWVEGTLLREPTVGDMIIMHRTKRNGIDAQGFFNTSAITNIVEENETLVITTRSSVYVVSEVVENTH